MSIVAKALRDARTAAGLQQQEVARVLGISPSYLSDMEQGRRQLGLRHLARLPPVMRSAVAAAWCADRENEIAEARKAAS